MSSDRGPGALAGRAPGDRPIRILLVDDQALVRAGFSSILAKLPDLEVVGEAGDGAEAVELATRLRPDLVLMDIRMPRLDGVEATRRIMELVGERPRVLVLTTFDLDEYVYQAVRAGASGFLLKDVTRRTSCTRCGWSPAASRCWRPR